MQRLVRGEEYMDWIDLVVRDVCELDYTSPDGQADVMLVTAAELRVILENHAPSEHDAERYQWLRRWKGQEHEPPFTVQHALLDGALWGGDLDAAIDAARAVGAA
jgi:hypothetical protein